MTQPNPAPPHPLTTALCAALRSHEPSASANMVDYTPGETAMIVDGWWHTDDVEQILRDLPRTPTPEPPPLSTVIFRPDRRIRDMLRDMIALGLYATATWAATGEFLLWVRDLFESTHRVSRKADH